MALALLFPQLPAAVSGLSVTGSRGGGGVRAPWKLLHLSSCGLRDAKPSCTLCCVFLDFSIQVLRKVKWWRLGSAHRVRDWINLQPSHSFARSPSSLPCIVLPWADLDGDDGDDNTQSHPGSSLLPPRLRGPLTGQIRLKSDAVFQQLHFLPQAA